MRRAASDPEAAHQYLDTDTDSVSRKGSVNQKRSRKGREEGKIRQRRGGSEAAAHQYQSGHGQLQDCVHPGGDPGDDQSGIKEMNNAVYCTYMQSLWWRTCGTPAAHPGESTPPDKEENGRQQRWRVD